MMLLSKDFNVSSILVLVHDPGNADARYAIVSGLKAHNCKHEHSVKTVYIDSYILTATGGHATLTAFFKPCSKGNAVRVACPPFLTRFFRSFVRFKKPFFRFISTIMEGLIVTLIIQEFPFKISDLLR